MDHLTPEEASHVLVAGNSIFDRSTGLRSNDVRSQQQLCDPGIWQVLTPPAQEAQEQLFFTWTMFGTVTMEPASHGADGRLRLVSRGHPNP